MLVTMTEMLNNARKGGYGIIAPNVKDECTTRAAIETAEKMRAPIIINIAATVSNPDIYFSSTIAAYLGQRASVPVAVNLDHGPSYEVCVKSMKADFTSIMVDCSLLPFEENVRQVAELTKMAHVLGLSVEAELGYVGDADDYSAETSRLTQPAEAVEFVERTGIDCLAVAIGTAHGLYPAGVTPNIDFQLLAQLREAVHVPLVLHGGSGSGDDNLARAAREGICKFNIGSDPFRKGCEAVSRGDMMAGLWTPLTTYCDGYANSIMYYMTLLGCAGKA